MTPARNRFARWQQTVEFWQHEARETPCCQFATDEEVRADAQVFDCGLCPVADALYELDADALNAKAWGLYWRAISRLTVEGHALGIVLEKLTADCDADEFAELLKRLTFAFDTFNPPPEPAK